MKSDDAKKLTSVDLDDINDYLSGFTTLVNDPRTVVNASGILFMT
jgi:hypothetical protein